MRTDLVAMVGSRQQSSGIVILTLKTRGFDTRRATRLASETAWETHDSIAVWPWTSVQFLGRDESDDQTNRIELSTLTFHFSCGGPWFLFDICSFQKFDCSCQPEWREWAPSQLVTDSQFRVHLEDIAIQPATSPGRWSWIGHGGSWWINSPAKNGIHGFVYRPPGR